MKKIMSLMLGLALVLGATTAAFAEDTKDATKKESKKKSGKKGEAKKADEKK